MRFLVDIPDDTVQWAQAEGINRQTIAKFMREELQVVSARYGHSPKLDRPQLPGHSHEWRGFIFNEARVLVPRNKPLKEPDIDTCPQTRSKTQI
jgi:hypothetical protein